MYILYLSQQTVVCCQHNITHTYTFFYITYEVYIAGLETGLGDIASPNANQSDSPNFLSHCKSLLAFFVLTSVAVLGFENWVGRSGAKIDIYIYMYIFLFENGED